jgi:hypothetical protein
MSNEALAAAVKLEAEADRVYPSPALLMLRSSKVATPPTALTVSVPDRVPPPALVPRETVTAPVKLLASLFSASRAATRTAEMDSPAVALLGSAVKASLTGPSGPTTWSCPQFATNKATPRSAVPPSSCVTADRGVIRTDFNA